MATETERKFLVTSDEYKQLSKPVYYQQAYLSSSFNNSVRIRIAGSQAFLTIKKVISSISRKEFEYKIPLEDAREMIEHVCETAGISKYRYKIEFKGMMWEVDEFLGDNEGLVIAELELESEDQIFEKPPWVGDEVSGEPQYYNLNLTKKTL
jgi:adenylate cyclase